MNVMTHGLEKRSPLLPLGIDVQSAVHRQQWSCGGVEKQHPGLDRNRKRHASSPYGGC